MEVLRFDQFDAGPGFEQAIDLLSEQGAECLVAVIRGGLDEATHLIDLASEANSSVPIVILLEDFTHSLASQIRKAGAYEVLPTDSSQLDLDEI
ncbi:MAG: hypothetical protein NTW74_07375, partial [Acidobacteria bacterium]|nr:hypothetical protein [Acidobacteriota bacterium]